MTKEDAEKLKKLVPSSTVEKLQQLAQERKDNLELSKEEMREFKKAANSILSSKNGKLFWKMSKRIMKIDAIDQDFSPVNMAVSKAYRNYYNFIMQMLNPDVRMELDREGQK